MFCIGLLLRNGEMVLIITHEALVGGAKGVQLGHTQKEEHIWHLTGLLYYTSLLSMRYNTHIEKSEYLRRSYAI